MYLLTNERYKAYQTGFSFRHLGHAPGVGLEGVQGGLGGKKKFWNSTKFGVLVTHMNGTFFFWSPPPGEGPKGQISLNFNFVTFKKFKTISHIKDTKHFRWDFHSAAWVMPQG